VDVEWLLCWMLTLNFICNNTHCIVCYAEVTGTHDGGRVLNGSAHLLSRDLVSQSASESWYIKYSVTSSVKKTPFVAYLSLSVPLASLSDPAQFYVYGVLVLTIVVTVCPGSGERY
jgi:hypothetical protein